MWAQRFGHPPDLEAFFAAGGRMGFEAFELGHVLPAASLDSSTVPPGAVTAVHHPCPHDAAPDRGSFVAAAPDARRAATRALEATLDTAAAVGAMVVVLHLGRLGDRIGTTAPRLAFEMVSRHRAGQTGGPRYRAVRDALAEQTRRSEPEAVAVALEALRPCLDRAADLGLTLAVETGHDPDELPTPAGGAALAAAAPRLGLWLDSGHVAARAALQIDGFRDWWSQGAEHFVGAHLHDAVGLRDHLAPGTGTIDFAAILARLPPTAALTLEVDWYLDEDEVVAGAEHLLRARARADHLRRPRQPDDALLDQGHGGGRAGSGDRRVTPAT